MKKILGIIVVFTLVLSLAFAFTVPVSADIGGGPSYQPSFVIWGGNPGGIAVGDHVVLWGPQWAKQVTDIKVTSSFKGYADTIKGDANTGFTWSTKPGYSSPPSTITDTINVIITNNICKNGSTISGTCDGIAIVNVDNPSSYDSSLGNILTGVVAGFSP